MSVEADGVMLLKGAGKLHKHYKLLAYLVMHKYAVIPTERLIDAMYDNETDISNPTGALKNTVYMLRKQLGDNCFIIFNEGCYKWNNGVTLDLDIEIFEQLYTQLKTCDDKLSVYKKIIEIYKGDLLPQLADEEWVLRRCFELPENIVGTP